MTVESKADRGWRGLAVGLAVALMTSAPSETRSQQFTLDQLAHMGGTVSAGEFPRVVGSRTIRARFYQKRTFTIGDGSPHTMFLFRASNCWLRERTTTEPATIDCRGYNGPGVFIPVFFVTPASRSKSGKSSAPELVLRSRGKNSLADYVPAELLERDAYGGRSRSFWISLRDPQSESLTLSVPPASAALVVCVPISAPECGNDAGDLLTSVGDTPAQDGTPSPASPLPRAAAANPTPSPSPAPPVAQDAPATPPVATTGDSQAAPSVSSPPPPASPQLHFVIRSAASATPPGWTADRMAKRLLALVAASQSEFLVKTRDGTEVHSSASAEPARSGDAVVVWSGDKPEGPAELVFHGIEGVDLVPRTQSEPKAAPARLTDPRIRTGDTVSFAEFRIAAPYLYDQWQARIEAVTKVYGQEQPDSADDLCQFSILIPRTGLLSFLTGPVSIGLERMDERGKRILTSQPVIMPSQLMHAAGASLHLDVQPTAADAACISQTKKLAPFATATGNATAAWKLSDLPGDPSTGRMDIRPSSLMTRGRWLLGLYGPANMGAGAEAGSRDAADAQDRIFNSMTAFLDDFRERHFQNARPESQATGLDLALIGAADAGDTAFSERNVVIGKFRQPPSPNDAIRLDPEGSRRLSVFLSAQENSTAEVSFRSIGQTIRHYSQLFGEFSGRKPPIAIYVGAARAASDSCAEWRKMTAEVVRLSGRPRVFGIVFANADAGQIARQLGETGRGPDEVLAPGTRASSCDGNSGSSLLFISFPELLSHPPDSMLRPAFEIVERWAAKVQN